MTIKIIDTAKACEHCGATFVRRDGENRTDYLRRKACSRKCSLNITHGKPPSRIVRVHDAIETLARAMQNWRRCA